MPEENQTEQRKHPAPKKNTKPPKSKPVPKANKPKVPTTKKPNKKISGAAIFSIVLLVLVVGLVVLVYLDVGGLKLMAVDMLELDEPTNEQIAAAEAKMTEAEQKIKDAEQKEKETSSFKRELDKREKELTAREETVTANEKILSDREAALNNLEKTQEQQKQDLAAAILILERMDADKAAAAISALGSKDVMVATLLGMASDKAALVLAEMETDLAAEIFSEMMSQ